MSKIEDWMEKLQAKGHRITGPRRLLLESVLQQQYPFTAEELYANLGESGIGRATVFRTLKMLQDLGLLVRIHLEEGCQHYQIASGEPEDHHHHDRIVCRHCGDIGYLDECPMKENVGSIAKRSGYRIEGHHLDLYGICNKCEAKAR